MVEVDEDWGRGGCRGRGAGKEENERYFCCLDGGDENINWQPSIWF